MAAERFPRLKPTPTPPIHPVPENAARGRLAEVYEATKRGLGVPWMGVVSMAFAHYPTFYDALWSGLEPIANTTSFADARLALRTSAEARAAELRPQRLVEPLRDIGYRPAEIEEIRDTIETFSGGNMPYVLMATRARLLLEGEAWPDAAEPGPIAPVSTPAARPALMEPHHADPQTRALFERVKSTLGLPFVNTDYRALARWPSYFAVAWSDLERIVNSPAYAGAVESVHHAAADLVRGLPNPSNLSPEALRAAASRDAPADEVLAVVRLFQWLLPGLAVNVACLRAQLVMD